MIGIITWQRMAPDASLQIPSHPCRRYNSPCRRICPECIWLFMSVNFSNEAVCLQNKVTNAIALANDNPTTAHPDCATRLFVIPRTMSHVRKRNELKLWKVKVQATASLIGNLTTAGRLPKAVTSDATDTSTPSRGEAR